MNNRTASLLLLTALVGCSAPEVHLIPEGYKGEVFIMPNVPNGVPAQREGLAMVYTIPENGILITQDSRSAAWHVMSFYYVDAAHNRRRLDLEHGTVQDTPATRADARPIVWSVGDVTADAFPCVARYRQFYVGTRADLLNWSKSRDPNAGMARFMSYVKEHNLCKEQGSDARSR